jgi:hypothetical protein
VLFGQRAVQQAAADENKALEDKYNNQVRYLNRLRGVLSKDREQNRDRLSVINAQLRAADLDHQKAIVDQYTRTLEQKKQLEKEFTRTLNEENKKQAENSAKEVEKALQKIHKMVEDMKAVRAIMLESEKHHDEAVKALAESQLDFERQIGKISESEYERRLAAELAADYKKAREKLELERAAASGNQVEVARIDAELLKLDDKYRAETEKAEQKSYLRRAKNIDALFSHVKSAMDQSISGFLKGTESFARAWQNMWSDMVISMVQKLAEMMLKWIEHHITMMVVHATAKEAEVTTEAAVAVQKNAIQAAAHMKEMTRTAERAAVHAYDAMVNIPVVGPVLAPIAAGVAFAAVEAFGMMSAAGGQYIVANEQLTMLHKNEMVLPAGLAGRMRDVVEGRGGGGGGGIGVGHTFNLHYHISGLDGADITDTYKSKLRPMIQRDLLRILKKAGGS